MLGTGRARPGRGPGLRRRRAVSRCCPMLHTTPPLPGSGGDMSVHVRFGRIVPRCLPPTSSSSPASTGAPCGKAPRRLPSAWAAPAARSSTSRTPASAPPGRPTPAAWPPDWPAGGAPPARGLREMAPNVRLCSPLMLPPFGPPWQRALNRRLLAPRVRQTARTLGFGRARSGRSCPPTPPWTSPRFRPRASPNRWPTTASPTSAS